MYLLFVHCNMDGIHQNLPARTIKTYGNRGREVMTGWPGAHARLNTLLKLAPIQNVFPQGVTWLLGRACAQARGKRRQTQEGQDPQGKSLVPLGLNEAAWAAAGTKNYPGCRLPSPSDETRNSRSLLRH